MVAAVTQEAGPLLSAAGTMLTRYDPDSAVRVVAIWSCAGPAVPGITQGY